MILKKAPKKVVFIPVPPSRINYITMFSEHGGGDFWATFDACVQSSNNTSTLQRVAANCEIESDTDTAVYYKASNPRITDLGNNTSPHFSRAVMRPAPGQLLARNQHAIKQLVIDSAINKSRTDKGDGLLEYVRLRNFSNDVEYSVGAIADVAVTAHFGNLLSSPPRPVAKHTQQRRPVSLTPPVRFQPTKSKLQTSVSIAVPVNTTCRTDELMDFSAQQWFATVPPTSCFEQTTAFEQTNTSTKIETTAVSMMTPSKNYDNTNTNTNPNTNISPNTNADASNQLRVQNHNANANANITTHKLTRSQLRRQQRWYAKQVAKAQSPSCVDQLLPKYIDTDTHTMKLELNANHGVGTVPDIDTNVNAYTNTSYTLRQASSLLHAKFTNVTNQAVNNPPQLRSQQCGHVANYTQEQVFQQQQHRLETSVVGLNYGVVGQNGAQMQMSQVLFSQNNNCNSPTTYNNDKINTVQPKTIFHHKHHLKNRALRDRNKTQTRTHYNQHHNYNYDVYNYNNTNQYYQSTEHLQSHVRRCLAN